MADVFTKAKRSEVMGRILGRGNRATELLLAGLLRRGRVVGWRRNAAVFGRPDFVFRAARVAVFVDGCFWHCCPKHSSMPASNRAFWRAKLARNVRRDKAVNRRLRRLGWSVVRIWEHDLAQRPLVCVGRVRRATKNAKTLKQTQKRKNAETQK